MYKGAHGRQILTKEGAALILSICRMRMFKWTVCEVDLLVGWAQWDPAKRWKWLLCLHRLHTPQCSHKSAELVAASCFAGPRVWTSMERAADLYYRHLSLWTHSWSWPSWSEQHGLLSSPTASGHQLLTGIFSGPLTSWSRLCGMESGAQTKASRYGVKDLTPWAVFLSGHKIGLLLFFLQKEERDQLKNEDV